MRRRLTEWCEFLRRSWSALCFTVIIIISITILHNANPKKFHNKKSVYRMKLFTNTYNPQSITILMQSSLARIVHAPKHIRRQGRDGADLHDCALGGDELRGEGLAHAHYREDVDGKSFDDFGRVDVQGWDCVLLAVGASVS